MFCQGSLVIGLYDVEDVMHSAQLKIELKSISGINIVNYRLKIIA